MIALPTFITKSCVKSKIATFFTSRRNKYFFGLIIDALCLMIIFAYGISHNHKLLSSPLISPLTTLQPLTENKNDKEVFGFAPYWTFNKLDTVDFQVLTTLAYFGVDVDENGNLDKQGVGYQTFMSPHATDVFTKAHQNGTRVVLTITQMDNASIRDFLDNSTAEQNTISQTVAEVKNRGIDGVNVDFEYSGNPGQEYRDKFTAFIDNLTTVMHKEIPQSKMTVSVYASAGKDAMMYDIHALGKKDLKIFMMAYDFGYRGSDQVIPTAPLYGYKEGKYWYDVSTAVNDFLSLMPSDKLILGTPWYGYNYAIYGTPQIKAETRPTWSWRGQPATQTYALAKTNVKPTMEGISDYQQGWDDTGKVAWKAYYVASTQTWRMIFVEDQRSLGYKYDFAKEKNLAGVGIWALGFDDGNTELWNQLAKVFGPKKYADSNIRDKQITMQYD
jgi:spore germination protein